MARSIRIAKHSSSASAIRIWKNAEMAEELRLTRQKLAESEERNRRLQVLSSDSIVVNLYKNLVENALLGVCLLQDGRFIFANQCISEMFGYTIGEFMQLEIPRLVTEDQLALVTAQAKRSLAGRKNMFEFSIEGIHRTGETVYIEGKSSFIMHKGKQAILCMVQDATSRKQAEELLLESAQRYQRLIKFLPEPIIVHDEGIILYANNTAIKLMGAANMVDLIGKSMTVFLHTDYRHVFNGMVQRVKESDDATNFDEAKLICMNGNCFDVEIASTRINNYRGKAVVLSVLRNLTERKQAEELLIQSEKLSVVGQLAAGVAHEIRNPLTSLRGFTQLAKSKFQHQASYFDIMLEELDRINQIVNEFMTLAKPHYVQFGTGQVEHILESVIPIIRSQAIITNVNIIIEMETPLPAIYCNDNQLKQVFLNIMKNAIEAMPYGGDLTVGARRESGHIVVVIQDQGAGISDEVIRKIGEPFFTTKETGTGLGLMVSRRIVEAHNGVLQFSSIPDRGTTVKILLPVFDPPP